MSECTCDPAIESYMDKKCPVHAAQQQPTDSEMLDFIEKELSEVSEQNGRWYADSISGDTLRQAIAAAMEQSDEC